MRRSEVNHFNKLYEHQLKILKLQGKAKKTIDAYARSIVGTGITAVKYLSWYLNIQLVHTTLICQEK